MALIDDSASQPGYPLTINLIGTQPGPAKFLLSLANSTFQTGGSLQSSFAFGRTVTPSVTVNYSAEFLTLDLPGGTGITAQIVVNFPPAGGKVQGIVNLPPG